MAFFVLVIQSRNRGKGHRPKVQRKRIWDLLLRSAYPTWICKGEKKKPLSSSRSLTDRSFNFQREREEELSISQWGHFSTDNFCTKLTDWLGGKGVRWSDIIFGFRIPSEGKKEALKRSRFPIAFSSTFREAVCQMWALISEMLFPAEMISLGGFK